MGIGAPTHGGSRALRQELFLDATRSPGGQ